MKTYSDSSREDQMLKEKMLKDQIIVDIKSTSNLKTKLNSTTKKSTLFQVKDFNALLSGLLFMLPMMIIDFLAYSNTLFQIKEVQGSENCGGFYNLLVSKLSQLNYIIMVITIPLSAVLLRTFSSIDGAVYGAMIYEFKDETGKMAQSTYEAVVSIILEGKQRLNCQEATDMVIFNIYIALFSTVFLFGIISLFIYYKKAAGMFKSIPLISVYIFMASIGIAMFKSTLTNFAPFKNFYEGTQLYFLIAVYYVTGFISVLVETKTGFSYIIPTLGLIFTTIFNLTGQFGLLESDKQEKLMVCANVENYSIFNIFKILKLDPSLFSSVCLKTNVMFIFKSVIFNLIHLNINVPAYSSITKIDVSLNDEYFTQGVVNLIACFTGYPIYFTNSFSNALNGLAKREFLTPYIAAVVFFAASFAFKYIITYIPFMFSGAVIAYLGTLYLYNFLIVPLPYLSTTDRTILFVGAFIAVAIDGIIGFFFGIAFSCICILNEYFRVFRLSASQDQQQTKETRSRVLATADMSNSTVVRISYPACFASLDMFREDLSKLEDSSIIDLTECSFVDMGANMLLLDILKTKKSVSIVGSPSNIYKKMLEPYVKFLA